MAPAVPPVAPVLAAGLEEHLADLAEQQCLTVSIRASTAFPDLASWADHVMSLRKITGKNIQAALDDQPPVTARNLLSALHSLFQAPACSNRDRHRR
jgi:hypothetical protein